MFSTFYNLLSRFRSDTQNNAHTMRINKSVILFIIFIKFVNSDIEGGGGAQSLRSQASDLDHWCDTQSGGGCPCVAREVELYGHHQVYTTISSF